MRNKIKKKYTKIFFESYCQFLRMFNPSCFVIERHDVDSMQTLQIPCPDLCIYYTFYSNQCPIVKIRLNKLLDKT